MKQKTRAIAALLIALSIFTSSALAAAGPQATVGPLASDYLAYYTAWMTDMGDGEVALSFDVWGANTMAAVGAGYFCIQEKQSNGTWKIVESGYSSTSDEELLAYDADIYGTTIYYQGVVGRQYKGSITAYARGYNGGSDSRIYNTSVITAK